MLKLKLQYFDHLMCRTDSLEKTLMLGKIEGKRKRGHQRFRWLDGITDSMYLNFSKLWEIVKNRKTWHAAVYVVANSRIRLRATKQQQLNITQVLSQTQLFHRVYFMLLHLFPTPYSRKIYGELTSAWSWKKQKSSKKHLFLLYWLCQSLWLVDHNKVWKILKEMGIPEYFFND